MTIDQAQQLTHGNRRLVFPWQHKLPQLQGLILLQRLGARAEARDLTFHMNYHHHKAW